MAFPGQPPSLRERKKRETRRLLILAALEIANQHGLGAVTVEAITDRAGVSARTFFNYFKTKEAALIGVDDDLVERLAQQVRQRPEHETPSQACRLVLYQYSQYISRSPAWELRRKVAMTSPEIATHMLGASAKIDRAVVDEALSRDGSSDDLDSAVAVYTVVGAFRAAIREHAALNFDGDFSERVAAAFDALDRLTGNNP